jgi:hypothetical protein
VITDLHIAGGAIKPAHKKRVKAHAWPAEADGWYVEPAWCSKRLFDVENFRGLRISDPCCGMGTIPREAVAAGFDSFAADLRLRGYSPGLVEDFLTSDRWHKNIVCNPPFHDIERFVRHALKVTAHKVAFIVPVARLPAAHWLRETPLVRIWLLTPRPSMPPGHVILAGEKPGGGTADYGWLVWEQGYTGAPELRWLHRDEGAQ